jgi:aspartyl aminopeptidase
VTPATPAASAQGTADTSKEKGDPLFPEGPRADLAKVDAAGRGEVAALALDTRAFLDRGKTPRRAVGALIELYRAAGATPLADGARLAPGARGYWIAPGGDAALLLLAGKSPAVRAVVATVDAPRIDLKQVPVYQHGGTAMFDTALYGELTFEAWLTHPLALYVRLDRGRAAPIDLVIGDRPGEPVLVIPDVPPHLARKVQRPARVDTAERLDAVAASSTRALLAALAKRGIEERDLAEAEAYLVPAGTSAAVGVDRALIGGYGAAHRGLAHAAVRALIAAPAGEATRAVVLVSKSQVGGTGATGMAFVRRALARASRAVAGDDLDALASRRASARTALVYALGVDTDLSHGVLVSPGGDDAVPSAMRPLLDRLEAAHVPVARSEAEAFLDARGLGELDIDAVGLGVAARGMGAPNELVSAHALLHARNGMQAWLAD